MRRLPLILFMMLAACGEGAKDDEPGAPPREGTDDPGTPGDDVDDRPLSGAMKRCAAGVEGRVFTREIWEGALSRMHFITAVEVEEAEITTALIELAPDATIQVSAGEEVRDVSHEEAIELLDDLDDRQQRFHVAAELSSAPLRADEHIEGLASRVVIFPITGARPPLHPLCTDPAGLIDGSGPVKVTPSAFLAPPSDPPEDDATELHVARRRDAPAAEARFLLTRQTRIFRGDDPLKTAIPLSELVGQELHVQHSEVLPLSYPTAVATEIEVVAPADP